MRREPCASLQISVTGALWYDWKILLSGAYCQLLILSQPARSQLDRNLSCQLPCWATPQNTLPVAVVIKYSHTLHMGMRRDLSSILNYHLLTHTSREWRKLEFLEVFHSYFACVAGHSLSVYSAGWLKIVHFIFFFFFCWALTTVPLRESVTTAQGFCLTFTWQASQLQCITEGSGAFTFSFDVAPLTVEICCSLVREKLGVGGFKCIT